MLVKIAIAAAVVFVIWKLLQPRYDVKIVVDQDGVQQIEGIAQSKRDELSDFFSRDVSPPSRIVILGFRQSRAPLRFRFRGPLTPAQQQRIRNFLTTHL